LTRSPERDAARATHHCRRRIPDHASERARVAAARPQRAHHWWVGHRGAAVHLYTSFLFLCERRTRHGIGPLQSYEAWLRAKLETLSSKSDTAKAINYTLNQWSALTLYCEDGTLKIDNNIAENALRCVSLGRNNAQPQIMRSLHRTARHERQCDAPCRDLWLAANCT